MKGAEELLQKQRWAHPAVLLFDDAEGRWWFLRLPDVLVGQSPHQRGSQRPPCLPPLSLPSPVPQTPAGDHLTGIALPPCSQTLAPVQTENPPPVGPLCQEPLL